MKHHHASAETTFLDQRDHICKVKAPLYLINNLQITIIVWQKLSAAREVLVEQEAADVFLAALAAILLHFIFLMFNIIVTWLLRFPEAERKAIIIMASQKVRRAGIW
jgi:predicted Na+-dependent transporter